MGSEDAAHAASGGVSSIARSWVRGARLRGSRCAALALAAILVPGLVSGGSPLSAALVFLFLFFWVWLPGCAFNLQGG